MDGILGETLIKQSHYWLVRMYHVKNVSCQKKSNRVSNKLSSLVCLRWNERRIMNVIINPCDYRIKSVSMRFRFLYGIHQDGEAAKYLVLFEKTAYLSTMQKWQWKSEALKSSFPTRTMWRVGDYSSESVKWKTKWHLMHLWHINFSPSAVPKEAGRLSLTQTGNTTV